MDDLAVLELKGEAASVYRLLRKLQGSNIDRVDIKEVDSTFATNPLFESKRFRPQMTEIWRRHAQAALDESCRYLEAVMETGKFIET